jgi:hypothetical protein
MEQSVQDGRSQDSIACQEFGPIQDRFIGGDEDSSSFVSVRDEPEEETGLLPVHALESELIDDQERRREVLL